MKKFVVKASLALAALGLASSASAVTTYNFNSTAIGAFGSGPYGSVTYTQSGSTVDFSVILNEGFNFVTTGGPHTTFAFNATGVSSSDIVFIRDSGSSQPTYVVQASAGNAPYGSFSWGIDCSSCRNGSPGQRLDPLTFRVLNATEADFGFGTSGSYGAFFSADVIYGSDTGAIAVTAPVPEPETYALMLAGLGLVGFMSRRRKAV